MSWPFHGSAPAVLVALVLASCGGRSEDADLLYRCDSQRKAWVQSLDPALRDDPVFRYELATKPLEKIEAQFTYDTGVVNATGTTDGVRWTCLWTPETNQTSWAFDD